MIGEEEGRNLKDQLLLKPVEQVKRWSSQPIYTKENFQRKLKWTYRDIFQAFLAACPVL